MASTADGAKDQRVGSAVSAHYSSGQSSTVDRKDERPVCSHCDKRGHKADKCWTLHPDQAPDFVQQRRGGKKDSKRDGKKADKKTSRKDSRRAAAARHESSSDESSQDWAHCAVQVDDDEDDGTNPRAGGSGRDYARIRIHFSSRLSILVRERLGRGEGIGHSVGIKGKSMATDWLVDSAASLHYCNQREMFESLSLRRARAGLSFSVTDGASQ